MSRIFYQNKYYYGMIEGKYIVTTIDNQNIVEIPVSECDEIYSYKYSLLRDGSAITISGLDETNNSAFIYSYNLNIAEKYNLNCIGKSEYYGAVTLFDNDMFLLIQINEKTKQKENITLNYKQFLETFMELRI